MRASTTTLEVCWTPTPTAQAYILEVQKIESMPPPQPIPVSTPVAVVKKQQIPAILASNQKTTVVKQEIKHEIKQELLSPKTPIRSPAHAAAAASMSILSTNAVTSSPILQSINSSALAAQQGQPIIITTSAPIGNLVSNTIVSTKSAIRFQYSLQRSDTFKPLNLFFSIQAQPKTQQFKGLTVQQQQHTPQSVRLVSNAGTSNVRVLSSGQAMRLAGTQQGTSHVGSPITTILRQQPTVLTTSASSGGATATTIGGKQILLQKPISLSGQNVLQLVKTSQGMAVQSMPKMNVVQKSGTSIQQQIVSGTQIVTTGGAGNQGKTALIGTNVVKLMSPAGVGGNKILMKNSNLVQVGKMGTTNAGKPAFVITNKQGQPIRSNQQFIFVTSAGAIRSVQSGSIVTSSASNFVSLVSSPQMNTITSAMASGTSSVGTPTGTVKMIRGVGQQGKPITFTLPVSGIQQGNKTVSQQLISVPQKAVTIGGKAVTVQLAPGNQKTVTIVSSASGGIQKTINASDLQGGGHKIVMMPSKRVVSNVITHKAIPVSATHIDEAGGSENNLIDASHLEVLDQLDGAFDGIDCDSGEEDEIMTIDCLSSEDDDELITANKSEKTANRLGIAKKSKVVSKQNRQQPKLPNKPKYVKMGLLGGAPPTSTEAEDNTEGDSSAVAKSDASEQHEDAANASAEHESVDENISASNEEQQIASDEIDQQAEPNADHANVSETSVGDSYFPGESDALKQEQDSAAAVSQTNHQTGPTPSETEAANILTTIKSGDLLRNNDIKSENGNTISISQSGGEDNVKILFSSESSHVASSMAGKITQKTTGNITTYATSGDLDALASAALQASSGTLDITVKHIWILKLFLEINFTFDLFRC